MPNYGTPGDPNMDPCYTSEKEEALENAKLAAELDATYEMALGECAWDAIEAASAADEDQVIALGRCIHELLLACPSKAEQDKAFLVLTYFPHPVTHDQVRRALVAAAAVRCTEAR